MNYAFAAIFNIEAFLKIIGLGANYFKNSWNIFDFLIVIGTNLGILLDLMEFDARFG